MQIKETKVHVKIPEKLKGSSLRSKIFHHKIKNILQFIFKGSPSLKKIFSFLSEF